MSSVSRHRKKNLCFPQQQKMAQNAKPKIAKFALFVQLALSLPPYYIMLCYVMEYKLLKC